MRRLAGLVLLLASVGCGGGSGLPAGLVKGRGGACTVQSDCSTCSGCRPAGQEVCLEKACYLSAVPDRGGAPTLTDGMVIATLPSGVAGQAQSAAVRIYYPLRTDGTEVTCASLLADPTAVDRDPTLNVLRTLSPPIQVPATASQVGLGANELPVGDDRVVLVAIYDGGGGTGALLAVGCVEHLTLAQGAACQTNGDCTYPATCETVSGRSVCGPQQIVVRTRRP